MQPTPPKFSWLADQPLQRKIMLAIGLFLALFLLTSLVTLHSLRRQESNRFWAMHTYQVLLELDHTQRALQNSQIGARGYMLTQHADQRALYESGENDLHQHILRLRELTADNALQQSRIDKLETLATQWRREVTTNAIDAIAQLKTADPVAVALERQRIQANYLEHRTVRVEDLNAAVDQMIGEENRLLAAQPRS
jgi:CHASE3 domain sensor protein